jgi:hypothetical protein
MRIHTLVTVGALALVLGACDGSGYPYSEPPQPVGTRGELGNGTFFYECGGATDPVCDDGDSDYPFDRDYAVGARFGLTFEDDNGLGATLSASAPERLDDSGQDFVALAEGTVAVIARRGDRVIDIIHLELREMADVRLETELQAFGGDTVELEVGQIAALRATPRDADDELIVGGLPTTWQSSAPEIADVYGSDDDNRVEVIANDVGEAEITVMMGDIEKSITISVVGQPPPPLAFEPAPAVVIPEVFLPVLEGESGGAQ